MTLFIESFLFFLLGLIIGSFLNVVIYRIPKGISIISPSSHCPKCGKKLKWYHNIPVISFIILRGKCAYCGEKISLQYPM
ncbi:MAG: prepilin peptidase, partial [Caldimicrobium sp.]